MYLHMHIWVLRYSIKINVCICIYEASQIGAKKAQIQGYFVKNEFTNKQATVYVLIRGWYKTKVNKLVLRTDYQLSRMLQFCDLVLH